MTKRPNTEYWWTKGYDRGRGLAVDGVSAEDAFEPLSGEFAGESIPEIFGSWELATEEAMDAYEEGYWEGLS